MGKFSMGKGFWNAVDKIQEMSLEDRKRNFAIAVETYKAPHSEVRIDFILMMALALGKHDGALWFREMIPLEDRLASFEKINRMELPKKTKSNLKKAYLGFSVC